AAQIPALLISVATGIIVTRAASDRDLGSDIAGQILAQRKAPLVAAGAIGGFALIPGLPKLPFIIIAAIFGAVGWAVRDGLPGVKAKEAEDAAAAKAALPAPGQEPTGEVGIDALELAIGFGLVPLVDGGSGGSLLRRGAQIHPQAPPRAGPAERVPIRDLGTILEAIGDKARTTRDTSLLSEYARQALGRAITAPHLDEQLRLQAITLDPSIEQEVLAMDPPRAQAIVTALRAQVEH